MQLIWKCPAVIINDLAENYKMMAQMSLCKNTSGTPSKSLLDASFFDIQFSLVTLPISLIRIC